MLRALLAGIGAGVAGFIAAAIALVILDLYLSGHGYPSPRSLAFMHRGPIQLSLADAIALTVGLVIGVWVMVRQGRHP